MGKEAVLAYFQALFQHSPERLRTTMKTSMRIVGVEGVLKTEC